jgi:type II secretory pathway pseudopilin PulG
MRTSAAKSEHRAFTVLELMLVVVVLAFLWFIFVNVVGAQRRRDREESAAMSCVNNLKQIGLAFRLWSGDNGDLFPMRFYTNSDGSEKFADATNLFRYFQVMSNELNTPWILSCLGDTRVRATNFTSDFNNSHVSYFVGLDADEAQPNMFLAGDRKLTNGMPMQNGSRILTTNQPVGWTAEIHTLRGNVVLADGSIQKLTSAQLRAAVAGTGTNINRLLFP